MVVKATECGRKLAKKELKQLFGKISQKPHTVKKVGVTEVMSSISPQLEEIEKKTRCIIDRPLLSETAYSTSENVAGATWFDTEEDGKSKWTAIVNEPQPEKMAFLTCAPNEDSDQSALSRSLIRIFVFHIKKHCILDYLKGAQ